jgi:hypothetical protein
MIGPRTYKGASLRIVAPQLPDEASDAVRANTLEVTGVQSSNPRKGHATTLMYQVCAEADHASKVLMLMVTENAEKLVKWYQRFGFKPTKDALDMPVVMVRAPKPVRIVRAA